MEKIAFCFLSYDTISHNNLWLNFFKDHKKNYTIYFHPKKITSKTPDWIKKNSVKVLHTEWCSDTQVFAIIQMIKKALKDKNNKYFCINSGACLPLFSFPKLYQKIFKYSQSRIYFPRKKNKVFEGEKMYPHYANFILNRKVAKDFVRLGNKSDKEAKKFLKEFTEKYEKHRENDTWIDWCEDETMLGAWLIHLYGGLKTKNFKKNVMNKKTTFAEFKKGGAHPIIFNKKLLEKNNNKKLKQMKSHSIFARKFTNDGASYVASKTTPPFN